MLDAYSDSGLNDAEDFEPMAAATRRAAEAKMRQRDRMERGGRRGMRAANRSHAPNFFDSDDVSVGDDADSGLLSGTRTRARRQYDERRDVDDMEGIEDVRFFFWLCSMLLIRRSRRSRWNSSVISRLNRSSSGSLMIAFGGLSSNISVSS